VGSVGANLEQMVLVMSRKQKAKVMTMEKRGKIRTGLHDQRGTALVLALFLITVLTVIGTMVLNTSIVESRRGGSRAGSADAHQ